MENGKTNGEDKIRSAITRGIEGAREAFEEHASKLKEKVEDLDLEDMPSELKSTIRKNPWKSLAVAVGLGFLAGYILKSNNRD